MKAKEEKKGTLYIFMYAKRMDWQENEKEKKNNAKVKIVYERMCRMKPMKINVHKINRLQKRGEHN